LLKDKVPEVAPDHAEEDDLRSAFFRLAEAVKQAVNVAGPAEQGKLREILTEARREVYKLLADAD
jgi:hypothetical protein